MEPRGGQKGQKQGDDGGKKGAKAAAAGLTHGSVINLVSNDAAKLFDVMPVAHFLWAGPLFLAVGIYFLLSQIGWASVAGVGLLAVLGPANIACANYLKRLRRAHLPLTDARVNLCAQAVSGVRVLKPVGFLQSTVSD